MSLSSEHLRYILGLKLRRLRAQRGLALKELAARAGVSISYLSEIEKGKKYPKADKILRLARELEVSFDDLISLNVDESLGPVKQALSSTLLREFPFGLFGVEPENLVALLAEHPVRVGALIRALLEVGRTYDVRVEQFLTAALRSYQEMHANYFADLERSAATARRGLGWRAGEPIPESALRSRLERDWGYEIDDQALADHPDLGGFRSVFVDGRPPRLLLNRALLPAQRAFVLAREIGYRRLALEPRAAISTWLEMESFDEVLNNFKASYFAGALLIDADSLVADLSDLFERERWSARTFLRLLTRHNATPEMLFYRLTELVPRAFGLKEIFFLRFSSQAGSDQVDLTKLFNLSRVAVPHGIGRGEHYCRRWPGPRLLAALSAEPGDPTAPRAAVQRSVFFADDAEFFVFSLARPLVLARERRSSVSIGFLLNDDFRRRVRFWDDRAIPRVEVHLTCERCRLGADRCTERVAEAAVYQRERRIERQKHALEELLASGGRG